MCIHIIFLVQLHLGLNSLIILELFYPGLFNTWLLKTINVISKLKFLYQRDTSVSFLLKMSTCCACGWIFKGKVVILHPTYYEKNDEIHNTKKTERKKLRLESWVIRLLRKKNTKKKAFLIEWINCFMTY